MNKKINGGTMSGVFTKIGTYLDGAVSNVSDHFAKLPPETKVQLAKGIKLTSHAVNVAFLIDFCCQGYRVWQYSTSFRHDYTVVAWVGSTIAGWFIRDKMDDLIKEFSQKKLKPE